MAKKSSGGTSSAPPPKGPTLTAGSSPLPRRKVVNPFDRAAKQQENHRSLADGEGVLAPPLGEVPRTRKLGLAGKIRAAAAGAMSSVTAVGPGTSTVIIRTISASGSVEEAVEKIAQTISALPRDKLVAGLGILIRDVYETKETLNPNEREYFSRIFEPIIEEERRERAGSTMYASNDNVMPRGTSKAYAEAKRDRHKLTSMLKAGEIEKKLSSDNIVNERTVGTGEKYFKKFVAKTKDVICGKGGPYDKYVSKSANQKSMEGVIGVAILGIGIAASSALIPVVAYCSVLLVKAGLKTVCEP
jgi:hypothetical protein